MNGEIVYLVTSGEYSDYGVLCAFMSEELAEAHAKELREDVEGWHNDARVEPYSLIAQAPVKRAILRLHVEIQDNGTVTNEWGGTTPEWTYEMLDRASWRWVRAPCYRGQGGRLDVVGYDHERVRKVFSEQRARFLADSVARRLTESTGSE